MQNLYVNAPTVGSDDPSTSEEELRERMRNFEQRFNEAQEERNREERQDKKPWKTTMKFFSVVVAPILIFIPATINAVSRCKKVFSEDRKNRSGGKSRKNRR